MLTWLPIQDFRSSWRLSWFEISGLIRLSDRVYKEPKDQTEVGSYKGGHVGKDQLQGCAKGRYQTAGPGGDWSP